MGVKLQSQTPENVGTMPVLPTTISGRLAFAETHVEVWRARAAEIGLSEQLAENVALATEETRALVIKAGEARNAAASATMKLRLAERRLSELLAQSIRTIRLFAETTDSPGVPAIARIPDVAPRSPQPAPATPTNLTAQLLTSNGGSLRLLFYAVNPPGMGNVTYTISRKLADEREFRIIGTTGPRSGVRGLPRGVKAFTDTNLPEAARLSKVQYIVTAQRGSRRSEPSVMLTVVIGGEAPAPLLAPAPAPAQAASKAIKIAA